MTRRFHRLSLAGDLFLAACLGAGCSARGQLHFPDPKTYLSCVASSEAACKPAAAATQTPISLELFLDGADECTIGEVARGDAIVRSVQRALASPRAAGKRSTLPPHLKRTWDLARRGATGGVEPEDGGDALVGRLNEDTRVVPGSRAALLALTGSTTRSLNDYFGAMRGAAGEGKQATALQLNAKDTRKFVEAIHQASIHDAWRPVYLAALAKMEEMENNLIEMSDPKERDGTLRQIVTTEAVASAALFVGEYIKAYFRSGRFFDFVVDPANVEGSLAEELSRRLLLDDTQSKDLAKKALAGFAPWSTGPDGKAHFLAKLSGGFVTRAGTKLSFPDVDVTFTPLASSPFAVSKVDLSSVAADVVRVFLEAVGDASGGVPGDPQSTGCLTKNNAGEPLLPCFDSQKYETVKAEDFSAITAHANSVDAMVGEAVGSAIRGGGWFSLNNEAVAKILETAAAVTARKAAEKLAWCYYACGGPKKDEGRLGIRWEGEVVIPVKIRR